MRNPFNNPPRLSPTKRNGHSRSPSSSPVRDHARNRDSLLRDLSPSRTLRAFASQPNELNREEVGALARSIDTYSHSERALGARAAQTCLDVRSWTEELESWEWPGHFDTPVPSSRKLRMSTMTFDSALSQVTGSTPDVEDGPPEYWGSLPAAQVEAYERRADEITQHLDQVNVEELKDYVLTSHYRADLSSSTENGHPDAGTRMTEWRRLDDFIAVVTATILQTLPYLSRLHELLDVWTIRLVILKAAPHYLHDLKRARTDLHHGWGAIAVAPSSAPGSLHASFSRQTMNEMKDVIERQVTSLGMRLDRFLDDLEGREETVPASWIDNFELLESAYGAWVVQAQQKVLENEFQASHNEFQASSPRNLAVPQPSLTAMAKDKPNEISEVEDPELDHDAVMRPSPTPTKDRFELAGSSPKPTHAEPAKERPHTPRANMEHRPLSSNPVEPNLMAQMPEEMPPSSHSDRSMTPVPDSTGKPDSVSSFAKKRATFLGNLERSNSLKQSKSPVRPFERASNSFTRLFKKDKSPEHRLSKKDKAYKRGKAGDKVASLRDQHSSPSSPLANSPILDSTQDGSVRGPPRTPTGPSHGGAYDGQSDGTHQADMDGMSPPSQDGDNLQNTVLKPRPDTYQPTGLSSPFRSSHDPHDFPENWPLVSPTDTPSRMSPEPQYAQLPSDLDQENGPVDLKQPSVPLSTDAFHRMFVQGIPVSSRDREAYIRLGDARTTTTDQNDGSSSFPRPSTAPGRDPYGAGNPVAYLDNVSAARPRPSTAHSRTPRSQTVELSTVRPGSMMLEKPIQAPYPFDSDLLVAQPEGETSALELENGTDLPHSVGQDIPGPQPISSSASPSRRPLARLEIPPSKTSSSVVTPDAEDEHADDSSSNLVFSTPTGEPAQSYFPEDSIAREARSSAADPTTPTATGQQLSTSPMSYKGMVVFPTPPGPSSLRSRPTSPVVESPVGPHPHGLRSHPVSPSSSIVGITERAIKGDRHSKTASRSSKQYTFFDSDHSPPLSPSKRHAADRIGEDNFDRHVSEVLETLPARINFKSRPGAETPQPRSHEHRLSSGPRPKFTNRVSSRAGSLTLAPAEPSAKKSSSASEPEVKLYHLTQAGRDEPIKLFVRLVGEGERVMVRVGGGWSDLADYLRQYAEHHGSRTTSEGTLEIHPVTGMGNRRVSSGPMVDARTKAPVTPAQPDRPLSPDGSREEWLRQPQPLFSMGEDDDSPQEDQQPQPPQPSKSTSENHSSRPSSAGSLSAPSRQDTGGEVGLSGGKRKSELPQEKARWVEGMLDKAKKASAEKSKDDKERYFGDLGKAGGTRRLVFRSSSGATGGAK